MAKLTLGLFDSNGKHHRIETDQAHSSLVVVNNIDAERDNSLIRLIIQEPGLQKREALFFLSVRITKQGRPELVLVEKDKEDNQRQQSLLGHWEKEWSKAELSDLR